MIRLALIGCPAAPEHHARLAARLRGARFTAVVDRDLNTARHVALALEAPTAASDFAAFLSQHGGEFDAAIVTCDGRFDHPFCTELAAAGKHQLVAAPIAATAAAARDVVAACERAGVRLMVGQAHRYLPSIRTVKEALDAKKLGELGLLRIHRWEPPAREPTWRLLTREIDVACWLFGRAPERVHAVARPLASDAPDYVQLHLGFGGGTSALIDLARTLPPGDGYYSLTVIGSTGAAYADDHHDRQLLFGRGHPQALITGQGDTYQAAMVQEFVDAVTSSREPAIPAADGLRALEVAAACELAGRKQP